MNVTEISSKSNEFSSNINDKVNKKYVFLERIKSTVNTNSTFNIERMSNNSVQSADEKVKAVFNETANEISNKPFNPNLKLGDLNKLIDYLNDISNNIIVSSEDSNKVIKNQRLEKKENIEKLPDWITSSGKKELNTNQKLYFSTEKKRSFKNLLKPIISPFKFINRSLLPIRINYENLNINEGVDTFKFDNISSNKDAFIKFSNKLHQLNETFTENINEVISKKIKNRKKIDIAIKYHTLERMLVCKFVHEIKQLQDELKADLAKNKFQEGYFDLPNEIVNKLNTNINLNIDDLFSSKTIDDLKNLIKEKVNNQDKNVKIGTFIDNVFDEKNKLVMVENFKDDLNGAKEELSLNLTKELFKCLSKDDEFIGEKESISKIDNLIKMVNKDVYQRMGGVTDELINSLCKGFYENIKQNDHRDNLIIRLFRNSSNNINYKWAGDSIALLAFYGYFENKNYEYSNYISGGKAIEGGEGSSYEKNTKIENELRKISNRLGLNFNNLDESIEEIIRKLIANYSKPI